MSTKKSGLGKGLSALLGDSVAESAGNNAASTQAKTETSVMPDISRVVVGAVSQISLNHIEANPFQPRTEFDEGALNELADSIRQQGIIQPITVRKVSNDRYQIISGERRFKASRIAGLESVPAYVRTANDQSMLEMALVENIQREDLNSIEVALSYQRLIDECSLTQDQLSQKISKSRSSITNHIRLLKLPADIQAGVRDNLISMGHARALVSAGEEQIQLAIFNKILLESLSVRDVEILIKQGNTGEISREESQKPREVNGVKSYLTSNQVVFKEHLADKLSSKIELKKTSNGTGKIIINFNSDVDFNRIIELLNK